LTDLPKEILTIISGYLSARKDFGALLFTSKVFKPIVSSAWSKLSLRADNKITYHQFRTLKAERLKSVVELDVSYCNQMSNGLFLQILSQIPNVKMLKMRGCRRLTKQVADGIGRLRLTYLDVRECNYDLSIELSRQEEFLSSLTGLAADPTLFASCVTNLDLDLIRNLKFNTEQPIQMDPGEFIGALESFGILEELSISFSKPLHLDMKNFTKLKSLVVTSPIWSIALANPRQMRKVRVHIVKDAKSENTASEGYTDEVIDQTVNVESLVLFGGSNKLKLTNYPKLRKFGGDSIITNNIDELVNFKALEKIWIGSGLKEIDAIKVLTANDKLIAVQYDEQLSTESLEALAKLRVEKLKVFLHGDVRFDWGKFKLKSLKIRIDGEADKQALFKQLKSIPQLEEISIFFRLSGEELAKQTVAHYFEGFPALKRITIRTPLPQSLISLESVFFNQLYAMKQITFVDVRHRNM
jgi:hypothetical protein